MGALIRLSTMLFNVPKYPLKIKLNTRFYIKSRNTVMYLCPFNLNLARTNMLSPKGHVHFKDFYLLYGWCHDKLNNNDFLWFLSHLLKIWGTLLWPREFTYFAMFALGHKAKFRIKYSVSENFDFSRLFQYGFLIEPGSHSLVLSH